MSYDPRRGSSNYLGMDMETNNLTEPVKASRTTSSPARAKNKRRRTQRASAANDADKTMVAPPATARRGSSAQASPARDPYARGAVPSPRPVSSPRQQAYDAHGPVSDAGRVVRDRMADPIASAQCFFLRLLAVVLRLIAIALALLVVASAFLSGSARGTLLEALRLTPLVVPPALLGRFVYETPFGGVVRGDLAIVSIILFCADYVCMRFSTSLRERRERGA